eukprot:6082465-Prymnesium_polylepis.2
MRARKRRGARASRGDSGCGPRVRALSSAGSPHQRARLAASCTSASSRHMRHRLDVRRARPASASCVG